MTNSQKILVAAVLLLVGGALACMGGPQKPSVEILDDRSGVDVRDHYDWVIAQARQPSPQPISLTVYNGCLEEIGRLYIYQPSDPNKGPNQISGSIPIGGSEVFSLQPGMWAITAENASGAHLDHMNARDLPAGEDVLWNACAVG